jgi:tRNA (guanine-N7-)-methyltransferase
MSDHPPHATPAGQEARVRRPVRSFVLRGGRLTAGQQRALDEFWPRWGIEPGGGELDFAATFGNAGPVILEIGFGNGDATWRMAEAEPQHNFLAVEVHRPGVGRLLLSLEQRGIGNVRVVCADAVQVLREWVPPGSLDGVRIYFPDPWPKQRHHKRRILQAAFVDLLAARMRSGAILHLATDWAPYAEHMLEVLHGSGRFANLSPAGGSCPRPEWRPRTKYECRGERLGHPVSDLVFRRLPGRALHGLE